MSAIMGNNKEKQEEISKQSQSDVKVTARALGNCTMYMKLIISLFLRIWKTQISIFREGIGIEEFYVIRKTLKESRAVNFFSGRFSRLSCLMRIL